MLTLLVTTVLTQQGWVNQQKLENQRAQAAAEVAEQQAQQDARVAEQQAQQESLQTYLGDMGELILRDTSPLRAAEPGSEVSTLARAKTLTVLLGLDAQSKGILLRFLKEEALINAPSPIVNLSGADLSYAELSSVDNDRYLFSMAGTHLVKVNLYRAQMEAVVLDKANLSNAYLTFANLRYADLSDADLSDAILSGAILSYATLFEANLNEATLIRADLSGATGVTKRDLEAQHVRLKPTMPPIFSNNPRWAPPRSCLA